MKYWGYVQSLTGLALAMVGEDWCSEVFHTHIVAISSVD